MLEETYHQFVSKAAEGRKMTYDKLEELAQGRVYTGRMAKKLGLVDELGTLQDAVAAAKTAAGLKADAEVELLVLPESKIVLRAALRRSRRVRRLGVVAAGRLQDRAADEAVAADALRADAAVDALCGAGEVALVLP